MGKTTKVASEVLHIYRVAPDVKEALASDAQTRDVSVNDRAVLILADHFGVAFEGTARRSPGTHTSAGPLLLRVPPALYRKVADAAARGPKGARSIVAVFDAVMRAHYELDALAAA